MTEKRFVFKTWKSWLLLTLVLVLICAMTSGCLAMMLSATTDDDKGTAIKVDSTENTDGTENSDSSDAVEDEPSNVFHPGDVIETSDFRITYQECDTDWRGYSQYTGPDSGNKIVRAYFVFENISSRDQGCGSWDFDCYADGVACKSYIWSSDDVLSGYENISPGRKCQGYAYFEVPANAESVELEYETSYWSQNKVIFVVE